MTPLQWKMRVTPPVENDPPPMENDLLTPPMENDLLTPPMENDKLIRIDPLSGNKE